jgi:hypothetical protein
MIDILKGAALIGTFIGVLAIFAIWVSRWENVWQVSVEPTRAQIYKARIGPLTALHPWHGGGSGRRVVG